MPFNKPFQNATLMTGVIILSACASTRPAASSDTPSFGRAVQKNLTAQIVEPSPEQKADTYIPANRARRTLAREAYETDSIEPLPESITTDDK
ncbi:MAG: hypothetical protein ABJG88_06465 [Litorimonas sp.]